MEYYTAAPQVEYVTAAPRYEYAPQVEYVSAAPVTEEFFVPSEYVSRPVVQSMQAGPRNLLAMGNVISERVISVDELASEGRFFEADAEREPVRTIPAPTMIQSAPVVYETLGAPRYETMQPQMFEYVDAAPTMQPQMFEYVGAAPTMQPQMFEYVDAAPTIMSGAPMVYETFGAEPLPPQMMQYVSQAPFGY